MNRKILLLMWAVFVVFTAIATTSLPNNFYRYPQCTWYAAETMPEVLVFRGNAKDWANLAKKAGFTVVDYPIVGSTVVFQPGVQGIPATTPKDMCNGQGCGHVGHTEKVENDKNYFWYSSTNVGKDPGVVKVLRAHKGEGVLFILPKTYKEEVQPTQPNKIQAEPSLLHELQLVYFSLADQKTGKMDVVLINADGTNEKIIANNIYLAQKSLKWSPDGKLISMIARQGDSTDQPDEIWFINPDTGNKKIINFSKYGVKLNPDLDTLSIPYAWSEDSTKIVTNCYEEINQQELPYHCITDINNGTIRKVENNLKPLPLDYFWANNIIYIFNRELFSMKPDGNDLKQISNFKENNIIPRLLEISKDGTKFAFVTGKGNFFFNDEIYVMNSDGNNLRQITNFETANFNFIHWSPTGNKIIFSFADYNSRSLKTFIVTLNNDGSNSYQTIDTIQGNTIVEMKLSPDEKLLAMLAEWQDATNINDLYDIWIGLSNGEQFKKLSVSKPPDTQIYLVMNNFVWRP